jgi:phosphoglycolate phosphatase
MLPAPLIVFDLDGTLIDSAPDLLGTLAIVLDRHGFDAMPDPSLRAGIGHGARHLIEYSLHQQKIALEPRKLDRIHGDFLAHYEANIAVHTRPYPGLVAALDRLAAAGFVSAVCTNKPEGLSRRVLSELGLADRFAAICGGDTFASRKPDPRHLISTIAAAKASAERTIMVGDSRTDLDTARPAGVPFIGVSFGYTPVPMAELQPDLLIQSFSELTADAVLQLLRRFRPESAPVVPRSPAA